VLALELNDAQLILATLGPGGGDSADATRILASAPGIACVTDGGIEVGAAAAAQARLLPQRIHHRYWRDLSTVPLGRAPSPQLSAADLAFEQLRAMLATAAGAATRLLIAVPAGFSREQLGLLLGIASEAGAGEIGLVDAGLAACALTSVPQHVLHLELYRHCALLTAIEQTTGGARRARFEMDEQWGTQRLEQLCAEALAAQFVRQTRFDPLHQARTEQLLCNEVPPLLAALQSADKVNVTLNADRESLQVEISRSQWLATAEPTFVALLQLVQRARPAGQAVELRVGARALAFPGLVERLQSLQSCAISPLPEGAAARGALAHGAAILHGGEPALICQLPIAHLPEAEIPVAIPSPPSTRAAATHLLYDGRAWPLGSEALTLGTQAPHGVRALNLPAGSPGISRSHCRVRLRDGVAIVEDLSTYGTFINDERVHGSATLQRGDRLRLGTPGQVLDAIAVIGDEATSPL
jgi:hypothetical protein